MHLGARKTLNERSLCNYALTLWEHRCNRCFSFALKKSPTQTVLKVENTYYFLVHLLLANYLAIFLPILNIRWSLANFPKVQCRGVIDLEFSRHPHFTYSPFQFQTLRYQFSIFIDIGTSKAKKGNIYFANFCIYMIYLMR